MLGKIMRIKRKENIMLKVMPLPRARSALRWSPPPIVLEISDAPPTPTIDPMPMDSICMGKTMERPAIPIGSNVVTDKYGIYHAVDGLDEHAEKHGHGQFHQQPTDAVGVKYVMVLVLHNY